MTATNELIARAIREIESRPGYNYNPKIVETIISAGSLPDGTVFMGSAETTAVVYFSDRIEQIKDGVVLKTMPMTDAAREGALIVHAKNASRKGHAVGGF